MNVIQGGPRIIASSYSKREQSINSGENTAEPAAEPSLFRRLRFPVLTSAAVLLVLLGLYWSLGNWYRDKLQQEERADVASQLGLYAGSLTSVLSQRTSEIESLSVLVENSEEVTNEEFNNYVGEVGSEVHSVRLFSLRPEKLKVHLYPSTGSDDLLVSDPRESSSADIRGAVERTITTDDTAIIVTSDVGERYLEEWMAIRKDGELLGLANIVYVLDNVLSEARLFPLIGGVDIIVRDASGNVIMGDSGTIADPVVQTVPLPGGNWQLAATPMGGWDQPIGRELILFETSGLVIVILLTALVYMLASRQGSLTRAVRLRTRELGESRHRYQQLFEASPDALFVIDQEGQIIEANTVAIQRYGYRLREFRDMSIRDLAVPDKREDIAKNLVQFTEGGGGTFEWLHVRRNGTTIPVEINTRPIDIAGQKYFFGSVRDISERRQAEEALRTSEEKFRTLFEESRDAVFISTPDGRLVDINPAGVELLGFDSKAEMMNGNIRSDVYEDEAVRAEYERELTERGYVKDFEAVIRRKDGKQLTVQISATAHRDADGQVTTYRGTVRDVTEERRLSEQLFQAQKMESIGQMAGGIAHDFNNLLTAIQGYIDLSIARAPEDSEFFEDLSEARNVTDRATELTRQMLLFSRREPASVEILDLNGVIKDLLNMLSRLLGERHRVTASFGEGLAKVEADSSYIEQVIMNLVVNARDAMPGGGEITISTGNVHLDESFTRKHNPETQAGEYVLLSVRDQGEGMEAEILDSIFEPFFSTKGIDRGTGLGLSVVYGIVTQLNGLIDVNSTPGEGSTFNIYLPVISVEASDRELTEADTGSLEGHAERILLVEDEDNVREIAERMLRANGYDVILAADADSAIEAIEPDDGFDLVFSDVILPGEDGFSLARRLQQSHPGLRLVLTSGYVDEGLLREIHEMEIPFLQKPYSMEQLLHTVRNVLDN